MKNNNDQAMESYFTSMLNEKKVVDSAPETFVDDVNKQLGGLHSITPIAAELPVFSKQQEEIVTTKVDQEIPEQQVKQTEVWKNLEISDEFQVLFFELAGLTFAIPLVDLGGIHHLDATLNTLIGKPVWFSGVMAHGDSLYNIVDTAKWIGVGHTIEPLNYSHYILLGSTEWGLSCEKLLGTETLTKDQIKWRKASGKRPWLAGMVKNKMCALIHAEELIKLLKSGMDIHGN